MKRAKLILPLLALLFSSCAPKAEYLAISGRAQGGTYIVKLCARDSERTPEELKNGIDSILLAIDHSVSGYNPGSLLSRLNKGETINPDAIITELYSRSRRIWEQTGGAVDVAAGPVFDIWGFGFTSDSLPSDDLIRRTLQGCGMRFLPETFDEILADRQSYPNLKLNFNCIAQGYSCDLIASWLEAQGVKDMMINVGGEIYCAGVNPSGQPWAVGIDRPIDGNDTPGADLEGVYRAVNVPCGIVTSGNYRKFYIRDGQKYSHTIDPRTGYPVSHGMLCATVIAEDATLADGLATYCMVAGLSEASAFIENDPKLEACFVYDEDGMMKVWTSEGFLLEQQQ